MQILLMAVEIIVMDTIILTRGRFAGPRLHANATVNQRNDFTLS